MIDRGPEFPSFWTERHLCTLTTLRPDGTPHVVPVGVTLDVVDGVARVITSGDSVKARNVRESGYASVCQVDGRRRSTLEGPAVVTDEPGAVRSAEARYAARYRTPRVNPARVVIEIKVQRVLGNV